MPDIVGVGAINVDVVVGADVAIDGFEPEIERRADAARVRRILGRLDASAVGVSAGGSALNAMAGIVGTAAPVSVGFVGVGGSSPVDRFDLWRWLESSGIDTEYVYRTTDIAGTCISRTIRGERSLLTCPGANTQLLGLLERHRTEVLDYLTGARIIHVTSLADRDDPVILAALLVAVRVIAPAVTISVDPGALWTAEDRPASVDRILSIADLLLVNRHEFDLVSRPHLRGVGGRPRTIVLKERDCVRTYAVAGDDALIERSFPNHIVLADRDIIDDTGTGDAFAAGLLCGLVSPGFDGGDAIELGMRLARRSLCHIGTTGVTEYRQDYRDVCVELVARR